jgi:hypothetical protein
LEEEEVRVLYQQAEVIYHPSSRLDQARRVDSEGRRSCERATLSCETQQADRTEKKIDTSIVRKQQQQDY